MPTYHPMRTVAAHRWRMCGGSPAICCRNAAELRMNAPISRRVQSGAALERVNHSAAPCNAATLRSTKKQLEQQSEATLSNVQLVQQRCPAKQQLK